jgi:general secretion pathway protein K
MVKSQRGAVLVFAMVVLMVVASVAVTMAAQLEYSVRGAANRLYGGQAMAYLSGAESLGLAVLAHDSRKAGAIDYSGEDWARSVPDFPVEGGWVRAKLEDAQGRININTLAAKARRNSAATGDAARFTPAQRRFIRLLQTFDDPGMSQTQAIAIAEAVIDWLDADDEETGFGGAEADYYARLQVAYRPANTAMVDITELRLVRGVSPKLYKQIQKYLVALPQGIGLNINSAPVPVVRSLNQQDNLLPMDQYAAERLVNWRDDGKPFGSIEDFLQSESMRALSSATLPITSEGLSVNSEYFWLHAESEIVGRYRAMSSLIKRDASGGRVVQRHAR